MGWKCFRCGDHYDVLPEPLQCKRCGYRIFLKERPPIIRRVRAI